MAAVMASPPKYLTGDSEAIKAFVEKFDVRQLSFNGSASQLLKAVNSQFKPTANLVQFRLGVSIRLRWYSSLELSLLQYDDASLLYSPCPAYSIYR